MINSDFLFVCLLWWSFVVSSFFEVTFFQNDFILSFTIALVPYLFLNNHWARIRAEETNAVLLKKKSRGPGRLVLPICWGQKVGRSHFWYELT